MGKKKLSGAAKRKKQKEKKEAIVKAVIELVRLKRGPTKLWTGLVTHHRDIFVSHVLPKLNKTDRYFFANANTESLNLLEYAGVNKSELGFAVDECSSISTLEFAWNYTRWGEKFDNGYVMDQGMFCSAVALMNKLELLKWVREEKKCEWHTRVIIRAASEGNLEMLKYCIANGCPYDEGNSCVQAARKGHLDCLRFLFNKVKPSRETEQSSATAAAREGRIDILKYFVEERKIPGHVKTLCLVQSALGGHLDCLKYLVEEAKAVFVKYSPIAYARYKEHTECLHYLREKGCPEPTDEQYAACVERFEEIVESSRR
jgi:hypothetical protein